MALHADTIWEVRTAGDNQNGGGFHNRVPGTSVDYTFQNAPQLDLTDLACAGAGVTTITSAVGGFTAAMVGNLIKFHAGANFLTEFFEIVTVNSANSVTLDRTPATGVGANGHGKVGGGQANVDLIDVVVVPGNIIYIQNGIYAAHPALTFTNPYTRALPLVIWGYNGVRNTIPSGTNRPTIQMGANQITVFNFIQIRNIQFEGTADGIIQSATPGVTCPTVGFNNVKFTNLKSTAGDASCVKMLQNFSFACLYTFIDCEFMGTPGANSMGINNNSDQYAKPVFVLNCYFHDLSYGIISHPASNCGIEAIFSIFAKIWVNGITGNATVCSRIINCTFDTVGVHGCSNLGYGSVFINNSFSNCVTSGINSAGMLVMNNNFFGCGTPWIGGTLNPVDNNTFIAPQFVTPGSNYALQRTSGLIDRAFSMRLGV